MWPMYLQSLRLLWPMVRRCITKKIHYLTLTLRSRGSRSHELLPSTLDITWAMQQQSLMLRNPMVKEKMHLKKVHYLTLTLGPRSHEKLPSTFKIMWAMHKQSLILLHPMVKEKMHLHKSLFDLDHEMLSSALYIMWPMYLQSLKLLRQDAFTRKFNIWPRPWGQGYTKCCPVPSNHATYSATKFEVATSNRLRKSIIWPLKVTLGSRSLKMLPRTLYIMWPIQLQSLKLLQPTVYKEIHLLENTLFDLWPWPWGQDHRKCCPEPSASCELFRYKV